MSRRPPNPAAERAAQNQVTLKSLLKLEPNKICADCKKNKHPRWASWNLGIFVCIRCSGIHRSMGTHISRVKSVDLDSWTDEQLQSVLSWGNARANKYWEAKLAAGHVPSEAKIENFIRTKYELKRWVMEGPRPDPATLDVEGDDDIPLSIVKEKQNIERKESIRKASVGQSAAPRRVAAPQGDLIGGDDLPPRASTAGPSAAQQVPPKAAPAPPKATAAKDSLFGLDFLSDAPAAPPRPASTTGTAGGSAGQSRPDLKQSILSLYASAPRPQPPQQHQSNNSFGSFGGMQSPPVQSPTFGHQSQPSASGGLNDAFAGLSFGGVSSPTPKSPPKDAFAGLGNISSNKSTPQPVSAFSNLSGGSFFDAKPAKPAAPQQQPKPSFASTDSFGDWGAPAASAKPAQPASSSFGDLFDLSSPAPAPQPAAAPPKPAPAQAESSVFNLSQPKPAQPAPAPAASLNTSAFNNSDVWGNAWGEPAAPAASTAAQKSRQVSKPSALGGSDFGWGNSGSSLANTPIVPGQSGFSTQSSFSMAPAPPKVAADEEFGGWTSSANTNTSTGSTNKQGGGFGGDDLFSNVWQ
ncbi:putative Arf-GAP domain-containing protein [Seiridium cardinale]|uniref:Arf-GAP domain-containing protein n=1 Tax=Seiridium cardinale TaxID=138064 RepID=A0ABR2Y549_9PEZI